jgi:hypothetical protein
MVSRHNYIPQGNLVSACFSMQEKSVDAVAGLLNGVALLASRLNSYESA